jgi:hypothetical protein
MARKAKRRGMFDGQRCAQLFCVVTTLALLALAARAHSEQGDMLRTSGSRRRLLGVNSW